MTRLAPRSFEPSAAFPRDDWETPPELFRAYHGIYRFNLDVAANHRNALCRRYFDREADGLAQSWRGFVAWMHPPHSDVAPWIRKARREAQHGATVVALIPAQTDAAWWHEDVQPYASVRFLKGQPTFRLHRVPVVERMRRVAALASPFAVVVYVPGRTLRGV